MTPSTELKNFNSVIFSLNAPIHPVKLKIKIIQPTIIITITGSTGIPVTSSILSKNPLVCHAQDAIAMNNSDTIQKSVLKVNRKYLEQQLTWMSMVTCGEIELDCNLSVFCRYYVLFFILTSLKRYYEIYFILKNWVKKFVRYTVHKKCVHIFRIKISIFISFFVIFFCSNLNFFRNFYCFADFACFYCFYS